MSASAQEFLRHVGAGMAPKPRAGGAAGPVGERVAALRLARGWSRAQLARRARVAVASVNRLEWGKPHKAATLTRMAEALGVSTRWLLTGAE